MKALAFPGNIVLSLALLAAVWFAVSLSFPITRSAKTE